MISRFSVILFVANDWEFVKGSFCKVNDVDILDLSLKNNGSGEGFGVSGVGGTTEEEVGVISDVECALRCISVIGAVRPI